MTAHINPNIDPCCKSETEHFNVGDRCKFFHTMQERQSVGHVRVADDIGVDECQLVPPNMKLCKKWGREGCPKGMECPSKHHTEDRATSHRMWLNASERGRVKMREALGAEGLPALYRKGHAAHVPEKGIIRHGSWGRMDMRGLLRRQRLW